MALSRRSGNRFNTAIWPGFVDAMTGLLLVLMFVLTIFMVIQFVLRETITGQETELNSLANEISALSMALGMAETEGADARRALASTRNELSTQTALVATLNERLDATEVALTTAQSQITGFEAQVAGLLADRTTAEATIAGLENTQAELLSEQEALNLALANARTEIDSGVEAARLAAARREALEAMIADLEIARDENAAQISDLEAAQLADAAAAEALRDRLANADTELTAMTLALEEKRREAEDTLTLLAATQSARDDLTANLAAALLAQQAADAALATVTEDGADMQAQLAAALTAQETTEALLNDEAAGRAALQAQLAAALAAQTAAETAQQDASMSIDDLQTRLAEAILAREASESQLTSLNQSSDDTQRTAAELRTQLAAAMASGEDAQTEADRRAALLAEANSALTDQEALSAESQRQVALLNEQVLALRNQVGTLQTLLNVAKESDVEAQVQIQELGSQLNTALARVVAEERRRADLEQAERERLEAEAAALTAEAQDLERFRSDFFGQMREILEGQDGVQIVGDRFVFSSEVLFQAGAADLSPLGQGEIAKVAVLLRDIADRIPEGIDWVIRVDGHTDDVPLSGLGQYLDNWELSQARALSVVRYMEGSLGIPPNRLAANGFGQYQPLNSASTSEARAQNRRIELKLTER